MFGFLKNFREDSAKRLRPTRYEIVFLEKYDDVFIFDIIDSAGEWCGHAVFCLKKCYDATSNTFIGIKNGITIMESAFLEFTPNEIEFLQLQVEKFVRSFSRDLKDLK